MKTVDEGRLSRRTVADAVEVLRPHSQFSEKIRPTIAIGPLHLPSGDVPFLVLLKCEELGWAVTLPTSKRFRAKLAHSPVAPKVEEWDIPLLDSAIVEIVEDQAQVTLADGRRMLGVEILPYRMPPHGDRPRDTQSMRLQMAVIEHVVGMCKAEDRCYRYFDKDLLPGVRVIDFNALHLIELPSLSKIMHDIQLTNEALNDISSQTVANILRDWGLRLPRSRGRRHKSV